MCVLILSDHSFSVLIAFRNRKSPPPMLTLSFSLTSISILMSGIAEDLVGGVGEVFEEEAELTLVFAEALGCCIG